MSNLSEEEIIKILTEIAEVVYWESSSVEQIKQDYIPKSKVREKIEKLKEFQDRYEKCNNLKDVAIKQEEINLLNKLLQEGDK